MFLPAQSSAALRKRLLRSAPVERALLDCLFALELRFPAAMRILPRMEETRRETREALLRHLSSSPDLKTRTEVAMFRQLLLDREVGGPPMRGPYYEEGELVRHLEEGEERLVERHLMLMNLHTETARGEASRAASDANPARRSASRS